MKPTPDAAGRGAPRARPAFAWAAPPGLYGRWVAAPGAALAALDGDAALTAREAAAAERWGGAQRAWGLGVRLHRDEAGRARVVEVLGPDGCAPHAILYRAAAAEPVRVDTYAGEVLAGATVEAALALVLERT